MPNGPDILVPKPDFGSLIATSGIRTHNHGPLSPAPLPLGYRRALGTGGIEPLASHLTFGTRFTDAREEQLPNNDQGGSRTHNDGVLSAAPLPVGLPGQLSKAGHQRHRNGASQSLATLIACERAAACAHHGCAASPCGTRREHTHSVRARKKPRRRERHQGFRCVMLSMRA